ncbi:hypothetical protein ACFQFG_11240 [Methylobacterium persicinum]
MIADLTYFRDDAEDGEAVLGRPGRRAPSIDTLALFALEEAIPAADRRRIARARSFALVIEVPSAEWVEPVRSACTTLGNWGRPSSPAPAPRGRIAPTAATTPWRGAWPTAGGCSGSRRPASGTCRLPSSPQPTGAIGFQFRRTRSSRA